MGQSRSSHGRGSFAVGPGHAEYNEYLQGLGYVAKPGTQASAVLSQHLRNLSDHHIRNQRSGGFCGCSNAPIAFHDEELMDPEHHGPFKTNLRALIDVDNNGVTCREVCDAACMNEVEQAVGAGRRSPDGRQCADEVLCEPPGPVLVPRTFRLLAYNWAAPSESQKPASPEELENLRACLKQFTRAMLVGVEAQLRVDEEEVADVPQAQNIDVVASLTQDFSLLILYAQGVERTVPLRSVRWVRPADTQEPGSGAEGGILWFQPSERDKMVVLRLAGGRFVRLRFEQSEQAAYFGTCMRLLVRGTRPAGMLSSRPHNAV